MVKRLRLNEKSVREAAPEPGRDYQIFDSEVRGFAICIYRSGNRAFTLDYRHAGRQRRMTLGRWPEWSTAAARERAKELRRDIDAGGDPLGAKEDGRDAPRFRDLIEHYSEVHLPNLAKTNASDQRSMLTKLVGPEWNNRLVTEITPYDVEKLLNRIAEGRARPHKAKPNNRARKLQGAKPTPVRANRVGEVLRKMFTYAQSWGWREDNPASGFRRRIENPRERFLSQEEIRKLASALDAAEDRRAADIIRLCMLTGARVGEVRQARFEHFNLEHLSWSKPASMTKQRKIHRLPISDEAAAIVRQRQLLVPRGCRTGQRHRRSGSPDWTGIRHHATSALGHRGHEGALSDGIRRHPGAPRGDHRRVRCGTIPSPVARFPGIPRPCEHADRGGGRNHHRAGPLAGAEQWLCVRGG